MQEMVELESHFKRIFTKILEIILISKNVHTSSITTNTITKTCPCNKQIFFEL